jgi:hypothetical protein
MFCAWRGSVAIVNRNLTVPAFTQSVDNGVLSITTSAVQLRYTVGAAFASHTLGVFAVEGSDSAFESWTYGQTNSNSRNLLGTIKSLDELDVISLNCTQNQFVIVHDECMPCTCLSHPQLPAPLQLTFPLPCVIGWCFVVFCDVVCSAALRVGFGVT